MLNKSLRLARQRGPALHAAAMGVCAGPTGRVCAPSPSLWRSLAIGGGGRAAPLRIALEGNIASGKSTLLAMISKEFAIFTGGTACLVPGRIRRGSSHEPVRPHAPIRILRQTNTRARARKRASKRESVRARDFKGVCVCVCVCVCARARLCACAHSYMFSAVQEPVSKWQQVEGDSAAPDGGQGDHGAPAASDSSPAAAASKENNLLDLFYSDPTRLLHTSCTMPLPSYVPPPPVPPLFGIPALNPPCAPFLRHPGTALHICSPLCVSVYLCLARVNLGP